MYAYTQGSQYTVQSVHTVVWRSLQQCDQLQQTRGRMEVKEPEEREGAWRIITAGNGWGGCQTVHCMYAALPWTVYEQCATMTCTWTTP